MPRAPDPLRFRQAVGVRRILRTILPAAAAALLAIAGPVGVGLATAPQHNKRARGVVIDGTRWDDRLVGTFGRDIIRGKAGDDTIRGKAGDDKLLGGRGDDTVSGDAGNDIIDGGPGEDLLLGGAGNDRIRARDGAQDTISCGKGRDTVIADRNDVVARDCEVIKLP